jgi:hypothetical protein
MEQLIVLALTTLIGAFIGSYLASYLKRKGENLTTHEDLDKLVEQVRAVTTTTKEIEAKISTSVWDRQKRWEMKREVLFEAAKTLQEVQDAMLNLHAAFQVAEDRRQGGEVELPQLTLDASQRWLVGLAKFETTGLLVYVVCGSEIKKAFGDLRILTKRVAKEISHGNPAFYGTSIGELNNKAQAVTDAIRKELETDKTT